MTKKQKIILAVILVVFLAGSGILAMTLGKSHYENKENLVSDTAVKENSGTAAQGEETAASGTKTQQEKDNSTSQTQAPQVSSGTDGSMGQAASDDGKTYTPTFMFFYSESDTDNAKTQEILAELQKTYQNINFDIRSIDAEPDLVEKFPVAGATPMLIMLNTKNDISALVPMCKEKAKMEEAINNALQ